MPSIRRKRMIALTEKEMNPFEELTVNDKFPLAMAYVRWQKLERMYPHEIALERGTLFPELDKPFCGCTVTGGKR